MVLVMDGNAFGQAMDDMFRFLAWVLVIFVPLGAWKFVEIIIWVFNRILG